MSDTSISIDMSGSRRHPMDPEVREQWASALTSGRYAQGRNFLTRVKPDGTEENCCLGVLCELAAAAGVTERVNAASASDSGNDKVVSYADTDHNGFAATQSRFLPRVVAQWAGLDQNPVIPRQDGSAPFYQTASLAGMNDQGMSFSGIARMIRENL